MIHVDTDLSRQLLLYRFSARVSVEEAQATVETTAQSLEKLRAGFRILADLTDMEWMDHACAPFLSRVMDLCREKGVASIFRIVPDPAKDIGFNILSRFHYGKEVHITTFESREEANEALVNLSGGDDPSAHGQPALPMSKVPRSAYDKAGGMVYFPRMLDKIRLHGAGELKADYAANLGKGADGRCCGFLRVDYEDLKRRVLEGGSDEDILQWCFENGRKLEESDILIWNGFALKLGWKDFASDRLQQLKTEGGLADRDDIQTLVDYFDVDERRKI